MKSLFLRMRLTHWVGIVLLLVSAVFFTENTIGAVIQFVIAAVVLVHDLDEKRWGVDAQRRVAEYLNGFTRKDLATGCDVRVDYNAEIAQMVQVVDRFRAVIRDTLHQSKSIAAENASISEKLRAHSHRIDGRLSGEGKLLHESATRAEAVRHSSSGLADAARTAHAQALEGVEQIVQSEADVQSMLDSSEQTSRYTQTVVERLEHLAVGTERINAVLGVITEVAEQTNLLALNAAIEAARAGEQGRGFAVVADEVRALSVRSQQSLLEIRDTVEAITSASQEVSAAVERQSAVIEELAQTSRRTRQTLTGSAAVMRELAGVTASTEQAAGGMEGEMAAVAEGLAELGRQADESRRDLREILALTDQSSSTAVELRERLAEFTT